MCGINGFYDLKKQFTTKELSDTVHLMNKKIRYRGPNEEGIYQKGSLCMGMRRLSIIDIVGGSQPVYNEEKNIAVVYNGEIYNFKELKRKLKKCGHLFSTATDTEVIVHAFEEYGTEAFDKFDGMYAFALYDSKAEKLYLVRDRMGEKPLYYYANEKYLIFGSELKSLMGTGHIRKDISIHALNQFLQLTYIPAPYTIFENVWKLRPGHYLEITSDGAVADHEYWNIPVGKIKGINYHDAQKKLYRLMEKSVKQRMVSDVPVGAFLSSGIDSGSVVGLMDRVDNRQINTFTIGFDQQEYDERSRANEIVKKNNTDHHVKVLDYDVFPYVFEQIMEQMDEPFADSSALPTYLLSDFTKDTVTVVLTGDAGDEVFAGYNKYLFGYYNRLYHKIPFYIRKKIIEPAIGSVRITGRMISKIRKVIENADKNICECHKTLMCMGVKIDEMQELMQPRFFDAQSLDFIENYYNQFPEATELQKALYTDLKVVLEGDMLVKVDRMSMRHSIENRIPMLSKDIVEFSINLPDEFKIKGKNRNVF